MTGTENLIRDLHLGTIGSCTCMTKTPDVDHHKPDCHYRLLERAIKGLEEWRDNVEFLLGTPETKPYAVRVREGGGHEDLVKSLAVTFTKLTSEVERLAKADSAAKTYKEMLDAAEAKVQARPSELLRCLGFAWELKEVRIWPVWVCSAQTFNHAIEEGWLKIVKTEPIIPREGLSRQVFGLTPEGEVEYMRQLSQYRGHRLPLTDKPDSAEEPA